MKLYKTIKDAGKKALATGLALGFTGALAFGANGLDESYIQKAKKSNLNPKPIVEKYDPSKKEKKMPERNLILNFANPLEDFEARTYVWHTSNQLFGKGNDYLGIKLGLDKNVFGRIGLCALAAYLSGATEYYFHEIAHDQPFERHGIDKGFKLDFSDWFKVYPRYVQKPVDYSILSHEETFRSIANGSNQDEFNARTNWEQCLLEGYINFYDSTSFLFSKLDDFQCILGVGFREKRPAKTRLETSDLFRYYKSDDLWDDVNMYTGLLYNEGIDLSKKEYFTQALIVDLLSLRTWESFASIGKYLFEGERTSKPLTLRLTEDIEISLPLCTLYLTSKGNFCDMSFLVNPSKENPIKLSFGTDFDFIGDGGVDHLRVGGKYYYLSLSLGDLKVSPFAYLDMSKSFRYKGFSTGIEAYLPITNKIELLGRAEYNKNDIIENMVKGEKNGFNVRVGLKARI